jgi:hypothetical protein
LNEGATSGGWNGIPSDFLILWAERSVVNNWVNFGTHGAETQEENRREQSLGVNAIEMRVTSICIVYFLEQNHIGVFVGCGQEFSAGLRGYLPSSLRLPLFFHSLLMPHVF